MMAFSLLFVVGGIGLLAVIILIAILLSRR